MTKVHIKKILKNRIILVISSLLLLSIGIVLIVFGYRKYQNYKLDKVKNVLIPTSINKILASSETKIKKIDNVQEASGLYQFTLIIDDRGKLFHYLAHITKDGKLLFPNVIKVDEVKKNNQDKQESTGSAQLNISTPSSSKK